VASLEQAIARATRRLQDVLMWHATSDLGSPASEVGGECGLSPPKSVKAKQHKFLLTALPMQPQPMNRRIGPGGSNGFGASKPAYHCPSCGTWISIFSLWAFECPSTFEQVQ